MCPCRNFQPRNMFARTNGPPIVGTGLGAAALWPAEVTKCTARPIPMIPKDSGSEGRALIRFYPGLFFSNIPILRRFCTPWIKVKVEGRVNVLKTNTIHHFLWAELRVLLRCVSPAGNVNWTAPMTQSCANATTGCPCDAGQREGETPKGIWCHPEVSRFPIHGCTPKSFIYRWIFHYKPSILIILGYPHLWKPPKYGEKETHRFFYGPSQHPDMPAVSVVSWIISIGPRWAFRSWMQLQCLGPPSYVLAQQIRLNKLDVIKLHLPNYQLI